MNESGFPFLCHHGISNWKFISEVVYSNLFRSLSHSSGMDLVGYSERASSSRHRSDICWMDGGVGSTHFRCFRNMVSLLSIHSAWRGNLDLCRWLDCAKSVSPCSRGTDLCCKSFSHPFYFSLYMARYRGDLFSLFIFRLTNLRVAHLVWTGSRLYLSAKRSLDPIPKRNGA